MLFFMFVEFSGTIKQYHQRDNDLQTLNLAVLKAAESLVRRDPTRTDE